jgi:hypothetical protein
MVTSNDPSNFPSHYITTSLMNAQYALVLELEKTLSAIRTSKRHFMNASLMSNRDGFIRPIDCDQVTDLMVTIIEVSSKMAGKLKSLNKLQELSSTNYYELLMYLYSANNAAHRSNELLGEFRSICMDESGKQRRMLSTVQQEILIVARECEQIEAETEELLDSMLLNKN